MQNTTRKIQIGKSEDTSRKNKPDITNRKIQIEKYKPEDTSRELRIERYKYANKQIGTYK